MRDWIKIYSLKDVNDVEIEASDSDLYSIFYEKFSFSLPYVILRNINSYKNGSWDGVKRFFNLNEKTLKRGFLKDLITLCKHYDINIDYISEDLKIEIENSKEIKQGLIDYLKDIYEELNPEFKIRKYQAKAFVNAIENSRRFFVCPTSSGKTFIMFLILKFYMDCILEPDEKILIILPSVSLMKQTYKEICEYEKTSAIGKNVHMIYSGQEKNSKKQIYLSTYQSIYKKSKKYFKKFKVLIVDEAHHAKAESILSIMDKCSRAVYRVGMTGSLNDLKVDKKTMVAYFGEIKEIISIKELEEKGYISKSNILVVNLKYNNYWKYALKYKGDYQNEVKFISTFNPRNKKIVKLISKYKGNKLLLFNRKKQGKKIKEYVEKLGIKCYFIDGTTPIDTREEIRMQMEKEENAILVASWQCIATGFSIKKLYYVVFCSTYKSPIKTLQAIGRGLRLHKDKKMVRVIDFVDDMRLNKKIRGAKSKNHLYKHSLKRQKLYFKKEFNYKIKEIEV